MTVCIAAVCNYRPGEKVIVACSDTMVSTRTASSESQRKTEFLGSNFAAMFSGDIPKAQELLSIYEQVVAGMEQPSALSDLKEKLATPLKTQKDRMIESMVHQRLGLCYREFLERGDQIDSTIRAKLFNDIESLEIGVDLLIFWFNGARPLIFKEQWEDIQYKDNFACIGDGSHAAEQSLYRRQQSPMSTLDDTVYNVYEAKRLSEMAPTVGYTTVMSIFSRPQPGKVGLDLKTMTRSGFAFLEKCYRRYGPRLVKDLRLPDDGLWFSGDEYGKLLNGAKGAGGGEE